MSFFSSFFFTQRTINACPFITLQKTNWECDWEWRGYSTQAFTCIHTSLKSNFCAASGALFCCDVLFSYLLWLSYCAMSICFPYATPGRTNSKSFYEHKLYTLLKPISSGKEGIPESTYFLILLYYNTWDNYVYAVIWQQYFSLIYLSSTQIISWWECWLYLCPIIFSYSVFCIIAGASIIIIYVALFAGFSFSVKLKHWKINQSQNSQPTHKINLNYLTGYRW